MVIATRDVTQNRELLGSPALVPEGLPGEAVIAATNLYMVANHSESPTEFLYWLMKTPAYQPDCRFGKGNDHRDAHEGFG